MLAYSNDNKFKLTDKQMEAIKVTSSAENVLLYGGSRSTKTFTNIRTIVTRALAAPKSRHAIVRLRFNHVKQSVVYDTFPKLMDLCFPQVTYKLDKSDWFVKLPNDSEIWFGGLDDKERTEKILGNEYATIFINEASQVSYSSYLILITRLAQVCTYAVGDEIKTLNLKLLLDENPPMAGHWTHKIFLEGRDPQSKKEISNKEDYACLLMNPADNAENLPASYIRRLQNLPKRQRDRFWEGKFGDENENALWSTDIIEKNKVSECPQLQRIVVPVDPSGADDDENKNNDDIGIGVIGLGVDGNAYVLEDLTINAGPAKWGKVVASAYERHGADRVVAEMNYGGAMVEFVVKTANPNISFKSVNATRGKVVRAEPVSALHETGKIKFVGDFPELEDELIAFTTTGYTGERSPNRADWFVWGITELFPGLAKREQNHEPIEIPDRIGFR